MNKNIDAEDYAKLMVIQEAIEMFSHEPLVIDEPLDNKENIKKYFDFLFEEDYIWDVKNEIRHGQFETNIEPPYNRHYESKSVAAKVNGVWIGWTYWYGGGKHGEPEAIDWWEDAYFLEVEEKEVKIIERTWKKLT